MTFKNESSSSKEESTVEYYQKFNSFNTRLRTYITSTEHKKLIEDAKKEGLKKAKSFAIKDAKLNIPRLDSEPFASSEHELTAIIQQAVDDIREQKSIILKTKSHVKELKIRSQQEKEKIQAKIYQETKNAEQKIDLINEYKETEVVGEETRIQEQIELLRQELKQKSRVIKNFKDEGLVEKFKPKKNKNIFIFSTILIALVEAIFASQAFLVFRDNLLGIIASSIIYGIIIFLSAKGAGVNFKNYNYKKKFFPRWGLMCFIFGIIASIGLFFARDLYFRQQASQSEEHLLMSLIVSSLSFLIFCLACYLEYIIHTPEAYKKFEAHENEYKLKNEELEKLKKQKQEAYQIVSIKKDKVRKELSQITTTLGEYLDKILSHYTDARLNYEEISNYFFAVEQKLYSVLKEIIAKYRRENFNKREDKDEPLYWKMEKFPKLVLYYQGDDIKLKIETATEIKILDLPTEKIRKIDIPTLNTKNKLL